VIRIRPVAAVDATALSSLYQVNRQFLQPWEPVRDDAFVTVDG
jgi:ribosomal-protein-alanine N-acetyltransferase